MRTQIENNDDFNNQITLSVERIDLLTNIKGELKQRYSNYAVYVWARKKYCIQVEFGKDRQTNVYYILSVGPINFRPWEFKLPYLDELLDIDLKRAVDYFNFQENK